MGKVREPMAQYIVDKDGKKKSVILPIETYESLLEDLEDLAVIASRKKDTLISLEDVKKRLKKDGLL